MRISERLYNLTIWIGSNYIAGKEEINKGVIKTINNELCEIVGEIRKFENKITTEAKK